MIRRNTISVSWSFLEYSIMSVSIYSNCFTRRLDVFVAAGAWCHIAASSAVSIGVHISVIKTPVQPSQCPPTHGRDWAFKTSKYQVLFSIMLPHQPLPKQMRVFIGPTKSRKQSLQRQDNKQKFFNGEDPKIKRELMRDDDWFFCHRKSHLIGLSRHHICHIFHSILCGENWHI